MLNTQAAEHIPYRQLSGYVSAILPPRALEKYEAHAKLCSRCAQSIDHAVRDRAPGPHWLWTDQGLILLPPLFHEVHELSSKCPERLQECYRVFRNLVDIVGGEANPQVYTDAVRLEAERSLSEIKGSLPPEKKAKLVCGPIVAARGSYPRGEEYKGTILTTLVRQRNFLLYCSDRRQIEHFRVGGFDKQVYVESPHDVLQTVRESFIYREDPLVCGRYREKFDCLMDSNEIERVAETDYEESFIFMTEAALARLKRIINELNLNYNDLNRHELQTIIDDNVNYVYGSSA